MWELAASALYVFFLQQEAGYGITAGLEFRRGAFPFLSLGGGERAYSIVHPTARSSRSHGLIQGGGKRAYSIVHPTARSSRSHGLIQGGGKRAYSIVTRRPLPTEPTASTGGGETERIAHAPARSTQTHDRTRGGGRNTRHAHPDACPTQTHVPNPWARQPTT